MVGIEQGRGKGERKAINSRATKIIMEGNDEVTSLLHLQSSHVDENQNVQPLQDVQIHQQPQDVQLALIEGEQATNPQQSIYIASAGILSLQER